MSQLLSKPALIQQEIEDILVWAEQLEIAMQHLHPDLEQRLLTLPGRLKTLIVGEGSPAVFGLCTAAKVSRPGMVWKFDILLGRKQDQVRAVLGNWGDGQVQQVTCFQGSESLSEREELEDLLEAYRADSRLIAASSSIGRAISSASPVDTLSLENVRLLTSQEGFQQAAQRLQSELQRASLRHKSVLGDGKHLETWMARGNALCWAIFSGEKSPWTLHLSTGSPQRDHWLPACSMAFEPETRSGLCFASQAGRTFLVFLDGPNSTPQMRGLTSIPLLDAGTSGPNRAMLIAELGQPDLVRRLAALAQSWEQPQTTAPPPRQTPAPPTPGPRGTPATTGPVHLDLNQSSTDFDLQAALQELPDHAVVQLGAVTLHLKGPVTITRPLTLRGAGMDQTRLLCETEEPVGVLNFVGDGPWTLQGFTVERVHADEDDEEQNEDEVEDVDETDPEDEQELIKNPEHVVVIEGHFDVLACRFLGGLGAGLYCTGNGAGLVSQCEVTRNHTGLAAVGATNIRMEANVCHANAEFGIAYLAKSSGDACDNRCDGNYFGILAANQAVLTLRGNHCNHNRHSGICYSHKTAGSATKNECCENEVTGIWIVGQASPTLTENQCCSNLECGICYQESASGSAERNECDQNKMLGIQVSGESKPTLTRNRCSKNEFAGLGYYGSTGGLSQSNECKENGNAGLVVLESASPSLEGNVCSHNKHAGITICDDSSPTVCGNECIENGGIGIHIVDRAHPALERNHCVKQKGFGICYVDQSSGSASENFCSENEFVGILVSGESTPSLNYNLCESNYKGITIEEEARPTLESNRCFRSQVHGIEFIGNSGGTASQNHCAQNEYLGIHVASSAHPILTDNKECDNGLDTAWRSLGGSWPDQPGFAKLVEVVGKYDGPCWTNGIFSLIKGMIDEFFLQKDDPRLAFTITEGNMKASVGNRYAILPSRDCRLVSLLTPLGTDASQYGGTGGGKFKLNKEPDAQFDHFPFEPPEGLSAEVIRIWYDAVQRELSRSKKGSPYRKYHDVLFFEAAVNEDFRKRVLWEAFGRPLES